MRLHLELGLYEGYDFGSLNYGERLIGGRNTEIVSRYQVHRVNPRTYQIDSFAAHDSVNCRLLPSTFHMADLLLL